MIKSPLAKRSAFFVRIAVVLAAVSVASVAYAAIYTRTGKVTNVRMCIESDGTPHCLFRHDGEPSFWFAGRLNTDLGREACSIAKSAFLSGKTVTTRHTGYQTICGVTYTRRLWDGDVGVGIEIVQ
jgi:hypothetical protein